MKTRSNMPLYVVETADIEHLRDDQIDMLRCGDYLVKKTGNQRHAYKVTYKEDKQGICLSYFDCGYSETISYDYVDGHWVFNSKDVSNVNNEINKLAVRKIPAPESTTLTDEEIEKISGGIFIEGTLLGFENPILCPFIEGATSYGGIIIAGNTIGKYAIDKTTKVITLITSTSQSIQIRSIRQFNGKDIPAYPANTGTFVLKCVDGVLTWVAE